MCYITKIMILGYLVRKINILLFVLFITGCSTVKNNISNLNEVFLKEEVICPLIKTPEGSEELVAISENNNNTSYIGFKGIKKNCFLSNNNIKMNLAVNLRSVRKNFQHDDLIKLKIFLVSTKKNNAEFDRDNFELGFFLKSGNEIVERESNMSVIIPKDGKVYIGLFQN